MIAGRGRVEGINFCLCAVVPGVGVCGGGGGVWGNGVPLCSLFLGVGGACLVHFLPCWRCLGCPQRLLLDSGEPFLAWCNPD